MAIQPTRETVEFIFTQTHNAPEQQLKDGDALDTKMVQIFSAASVVIGLAGLTTARRTGTLTAVLLIFAVIAYAAAGFSAFSQLRPRKFRRSLQADMLWRYGWNRSAPEIRHALVADIADAYAHNKPLLHEKGKTVRMAVAAAAVEVLFVGAALISLQLG